mmetsp:Transcript_37297/g.83003  ORF Transcript_37297/g.83003 Transcript_37297/m.83003 type:complete len:219 (-) Transcript_37297:317-973(-)
MLTHTCLSLLDCGTCDFQMCQVARRHAPYRPQIHWMKERFSLAGFLPRGLPCCSSATRRCTLLSYFLHAGRMSSLCTRLGMPAMSIHSRLACRVARGLRKCAKSSMLMPALILSSMGPISSALKAMRMRGRPTSSSPRKWSSMRARSWVKVRCTACTAAKSFLTCPVGCSAATLSRQLSRSCMRATCSSSMWAGSWIRVCRKGNTISSSWSWWSCTNL